MGKIPIRKTSLPITIQYLFIYYYKIQKNNGIESLPFRCSLPETYSPGLNSFSDFSDLHCFP